MKTRAAIAAELRQALRVMEITPELLAAVRAGAVTREEMIQFLDAALTLVFEQVYLDFAERAGGVPSIMQLAGAERGRITSALADSSLGVVQGVAARAKDTWSDDRLTRELQRAVLLNERDAKALANYDEELKSQDPKARQRKLRDRRFDRTTRKGKISLAKRRLMVNRYRERLAAHRAASIARDEARAAESATEFRHWMDRLESGDPEASLVRKFWGNRGDGKVRDSHVNIPLDYPDGLPLDGVFTTRWGQMRYPHDTQGHIRDWAGCRCKPIFRRPT